MSLMVHSANAESKSTYLLSQLSEAKDYLRVKPSLSSKILKQHLADIDQLTSTEQLTWLQYLLRSSIALNDMASVESTVRLMLTYPELAELTDKFVSLLSSLGIFIRRSGHPHESILLFDCALKQVGINDKQKISLLISKGNSLSSLDKNKQAKEVYAHALVLAEQSNEQVLQSAIYNTLGILAIKEQDYPLAEKYLKEALQQSQRISRRSGQIVAGLQLMMLAVLQQDDELYQKLHYRISRLTLASESVSRHAYLYWIEKAHKVSMGQRLTEQEQQELSAKLQQIKSLSIALFNEVVKELAKPLGVKSDLVIQKNSVYQGDLLNDIHQCKALR